MFPSSKVSAHTYAGKLIDVAGKHLRIENLVAEGGFSFVFTARDLSTGRQYALKKVLCQNKETYDFAMAECDRMAMLPKHPNLIEYFGHSVTTAPPPQSAQEVWMLMEYASGSHLVNLMNERRARRFTEPEILRIFYDVCLAVAVLHTHEPPIAHRDLKVENVLLSQPSSSGADADLLYKLCDFGSCTTKPYVLLSKEEITEAEQDVQRNTTMAYRAPEQCDLYARMPITEKVDVWALGCVLYKLCYYRTPFEENGQPSVLKIVNCKYDFDPMPSYSQRLKDLIAKMLIPNPVDRPDVFWILEQVCNHRQVAYPLKIRTGKYRTQLQCANLKTYEEVVEEERRMKGKGGKSKKSHASAPSAPVTSTSFFSPEAADHLFSTSASAPVLDPVEFEADFSSMNLSPGGQNNHHKTSPAARPAAAPVAPPSAAKAAPSANNTQAQAPKVNNNGLFSQLDWFGDSPKPSASQSKQTSSMKVSNEDLFGMDNSKSAPAFKVSGDDLFGMDTSNNTTAPTKTPAKASSSSSSSGAPGISLSTSEQALFAAFDATPSQPGSGASATPAKTRGTGNVGVGSSSLSASASAQQHKRTKSTGDAYNTSSNSNSNAAMMSLLDMPVDSPQSAQTSNHHSDPFFGLSPSNSSTDIHLLSTSSTLEGKASSRLSYFIRDLPIYAVSAKQKAHVIKATSHIREAPKHKYIRRILWDLHEHKDRPNSMEICNNYTSYILMDRPIMKDPVVALKCLLVIHHLCVEGPPEYRQSLLSQQHRLDECFSAIEDAYRPSSREAHGFADVRKQMDLIMRGKLAPSQSEDRGELLVFLYAAFLQSKFVNQDKDTTLMLFLQVLWRLCFDAYSKYLALPLLVSEWYEVFRRNNSSLDVRKLVVDYWSQVDKSEYWRSRVVLPSLEDAITSIPSSTSSSSLSLHSNASAQNLDDEHDGDDEDGHDSDDEESVRQEEMAEQDWKNNIEEVIKLNPANQVCADCHARNPRWASINIGCFLCHQCAGLHRSLGTHISKVRSVTLDRWDDEMIHFMQANGNERVNRRYEGTFRGKRPNPNVDVQEMLRFVRDKYVSKKFYSADGPAAPGATLTATAEAPKTPAAVRNVRQAEATPRRTQSVGDDEEFMKNLLALGSAKKA